MNYKKGDKIVLIKDFFYQKYHYEDTVQRNPLANITWEIPSFEQVIIPKGTIGEIVSLMFGQYQILFKEDRLNISREFFTLFEKKDKPKPFGIVGFCQKYY